MRISLVPWCLLLLLCQVGDGLATEPVHWSFRPIRRPSVPARSGPTENPIDCFVQRKLQASGLATAEKADRVTLIRRLHLITRGIPPTPREVKQFVTDGRPGAWNRLVERVLADPGYGERWARHWLDLVRFGETHGFETNRERPNAWPFRDYVIDALNEDRPYDQFVREQIAGDRLGAGVATGFLVAGPYDQVKSQDKNLTLMQRQDELADMINAAGTTFMGLTLGCARCHDHKFDPITQRDYYALQAIFSGVQHGERAVPLQSDAALVLALADREIWKTRAELARFVRPSSSRFTVIDDSAVTDDAGVGVDLLEPVQRRVVTAASKAGGLDDPTPQTRPVDLSGGSYIQWQVTAAKDLAIYRPWSRGVCRIWVSWGCGKETHCKEAIYILDEDGDSTTMNDQQVLAAVDQRFFADRTKPVEPQSHWSGLLDCGVHQIEPTSAVLVRGASRGTVTADVIVFENVSADGSDSVIRLQPPVSPTGNLDIFDPVVTKRLRFTILETNSSQPCIDELEVFSGATNCALASNGTIATCSSALPGYDIHKLEHINDGKYGNSHSWISNEDGKGWVELEFAEPVRIDRVSWARDRNGRYSDRLASKYRIDVSVNGANWVEVASHRNRLDREVVRGRQPEYSTAGLDPERKSFVETSLANLADLVKQRKVASELPSVYAGMFAEPGPTHVLYRGEPSAPGDMVVPGTIKVMGGPELDPFTPRRPAASCWRIG